LGSVVAETGGIRPATLFLAAAISVLGVGAGLFILKVAHHGSNTSSTPLFLSRFPPKVAVIQCGADNPYGHPTPETLDRLQRVGAKVFRNDEDGDVIATIKDQELKVATTKR
jgi:competence protein ComEC